MTMISLGNVIFTLTSALTAPVKQNSRKERVQQVRMPDPSCSHAVPISSHACVQRSFSGGLQADSKRAIQHMDYHRNATESKRDRSDTGVFWWKFRRRHFGHVLPCLAVQAVAQNVTVITYSPNYTQYRFSSLTILDAEVMFTEMDSTPAKAEVSVPSHDDKEYGTGSVQPVVVDEEKQRPLARRLQGRHMQMIALGLFVSSGSALSTGGPAALLIGYILIGSMMCCTVQSLGELAIMYPVNGAFYEYAVRFIDPAWGFAMGWEYSLGWMITLPYELTAASITIAFWNDKIDSAVWVGVFLAALLLIQVFGVRGYGEVEFILAMVKVIPCIGFIILGIIIDCGGVPTDTRGYIGGRYWQDPGAFRNGFQGFCSVFVTAVITVSVLSVANSCTYGSTRVLQALAQSGRAPKCFAFVDRSGRPVWCIALQIAFGFLAFLSEASTGSTVLGWFLAVTSLSGQFAYASACLAHIRFRHAWKQQGRSLSDITWRSPLGVWGSYWALFIIFISVVATLGIGCAPIGSSISANSFFQNWLALIITIMLFVFWKVWTKQYFKFGVDLDAVDLDYGRRIETEDDRVSVEALKNRPWWKKIV
ncbi:hypothetical protein M409DRAFT_58491 [Zasmidium cellare ATCC 36951]|uniref:Amino acid permease/ SLC12A domain-containing protein n=1 Tax=Zasmidium cellare ATCC 36951 TaxID=1080233 RepID=A0A6A6C8R7_ZASCE|nr:uncharacterized protein M409DRAFT_58491 [Zasmidium cellare ATCC 36951]KAF2162029.1 hypothetical protein M409DRAFT_58491 [Zasmidium cellare ATCC 36951]